MYVDHPYAGWPLIVILFSVQLTIGDCFVVASHSHGHAADITTEETNIGQELASHGKKAGSSAKVPKCWHLRPVWSALPICEAPHLCSNQQPPGV